MAIHFDDIQGDVASIFLAYFKRAPEFEAMQHYVGLLQGYLADPATADEAYKLLSAQIYIDGVNSQEVPAGPTVTDTWYVNYLYGNILGRAPDLEGLEYWVSQLESGAIERAELVGIFIEAALEAGGRDEAYVQNRTFVAVEFAQWENSNPQILPTLKYNAAEVVQGVNEDMATVYAAQALLETTAGQVGATYQLTPNIDTLEGTSANDVFNAVYVTTVTGSDKSTFTNFDSIDGGLGTDTMNIYVLNGDGMTANRSFPSNATVRNVEIINVYNGGDAELTTASPDFWEPDYYSLLDVSKYQGVQQFWQIGSENDVSNVGEGVVVGYRDISQLWADVTLANGVNAATVVLENVSGTYVYGDGDVPLFYLEPELEVHGNALDTVVVRGSLASNDDHLDLNVHVGNGVRKVTIDSTIDFHLSTDASRDSQGNLVRINHIDASASLGDVFYLIDGWEADEVVKSGLTVTFGDGDDVIIFGEDRALTLSDNIDGGEGFNTIGLNVTGKVQTQTYDAIARTSNFDAIVFYSNNFWVESREVEVMVEDEPETVTEWFTTSTEIDIAQLEGFELVGVGGGTEFIVKNLSSDVALGVFSYFDDGLSIMSPAVVWLDKAAADVNVLFDQSISILAIGEAGDKNGTLNLDGEGIVVFSNASTGKFSTIDASELEGLDFAQLFDDAHIWDGPSELSLIPPIGLVLIDINDLSGIMNYITSGGTSTPPDLEDGLLSSGMSGAVAETVILGAEAMNIIGINVKLGPVLGEDEGIIDVIVADAWTNSNSSTYGRMDVIEGFKSTGEVRDVLLGYGTAGEVKLGANVTTLQLAFAAAAQAYGTGDLADDAVVYFHFEGDTYLFADTEGGSTGQYDNADFALKVTGVHNMSEAWGYGWVVEEIEEVIGGLDLDMLG